MERAWEKREESGGCKQRGWPQQRLIAQRRCAGEV